MGLGFSETLECGVVMLTIIRLLMAIAWMLRCIGIQVDQNPEEEQSDEVDPLTKVASTLEIGIASAGELEGVTCTVCLTDIQLHEEIWKLRSCCHVFHKGCLEEWIHLRHLTCPLCRSSLLPPGI